MSDMEFINGSEMPQLDYFVKGRSRPAESAWMDSFWTGEQSTHNYARIDQVGHETRAHAFRPEASFIHAMHEKGANQGRQYYDIEVHGEEAYELFKEAYDIIKGITGDSVKVSFYNQYDVMTLSTYGIELFDMFFPHSNGGAGRIGDYLMPALYMMDSDTLQFEDQCRYTVSWLRARSNLPIYPCCWHMTRGRNGEKRYMSAVEMDYYLHALQNSGADGVMWWAGQSEGIQASDGVGTTNHALMLKSWNHPYRYGDEMTNWVDAFRNYTWGEA